MRIRCVGGGPAGLYLAILARHQGHEVTVVDRNPPGVTYGWGVVVWDGLLEELEARDAPSARAVRDAAFRWQDQVVAVDGAAPVRVPGHGYAMGRQALLTLLAERAREVGVDLRYETEADPADTGTADLVVAADGVHSRLRSAATEAFGPELRPGRNRYIWLGADRVFDSFTFPFVGTEAGWVWAHAYGFDGRTSTFVVETAPETWAGLGFDRLDGPGALRMIEELFADCLQGSPLRLRPGAGRTPPWTRFQQVRNRRWSAGNVVLVGDAAHTTHFSIGSGTRLALEDAMALADALAGHADLPQALAGYGAHRAAEVAAAQAEAANSARWFETVPRYIDRDPAQFAQLLLLRRSSVLQRMSPGAYLRLSHAAATLPGLAPLGGAVRRGLGRARQADPRGAGR
jgi:2-polyprenyl-6-methoxyphenol hydroxylase-like FAD-dependent oxidoreductase